MTTRHLKFSIQLAKSPARYLILVSAIERKIINPDDKKSLGLNSKIKRFRKCPGSKPASKHLKKIMLLKKSKDDMRRG